METNLHEPCLLLCKMNDSLARERISRFLGKKTEMESLTRESRFHFPWLFFVFDLSCLFLSVIYKRSIKKASWRTNCVVLLSVVPADSFVSFLELVVSSRFSHRASSHSKFTFLHLPVVYHTIVCRRQTLVLDLVEDEEVLPFAASMTSVLLYSLPSHQNHRHCVSPSVLRRKEVKRLSVFTGSNFLASFMPFLKIFFESLLTHKVQVSAYLWETKFIQSKSRETAKDNEQEEDTGSFISHLHVN